MGDCILKDGTILSKDETSESGTVAAVIVRAAGFAKNITALQGDKTIGYMDGSDGWYLPTLEELYTIYQNKTTVDASLSKAGGSQFGTSWYWSCCQYPSLNSNARGLIFDSGNMFNGSKDSNFNYVCSVRAFN